MLPELTLALGSSPATLLEMTTAYTIFPAHGLYRKPRAITRIRDRSGRITPWENPVVTRVISKQSAREITTLLKKAITTGTGKEARGIAGAAGKTGTTNNNFDAWFIGYNSRFTTGIWLGHDRGRSLGKKETGGRAAAPAWKDFMEQAER
jgi:penicillin-binding protein 1A